MATSAPVRAASARASYWRRRNFTRRGLEVEERVELVEPASGGARGRARARARLRRDVADAAPRARGSAPRRRRSARSARDSCELGGGELRLDGRRAARRPSPSCRGCRPARCAERRGRGSRAAVQQQPTAHRGRVRRPGAVSLPGSSACNASAAVAPQRPDERAVVLVRDLAGAVVELELLQRRERAVALLGEREPAPLVGSPGSRARPRPPPARAGTAARRTARRRRRAPRRGRARSGHARTAAPAVP